MLKKKNRLSITVLKFMPYDQYLCTEHWQNVRKRALKRAKNRCQVCGNKKGLNVHHNTYARRGHEDNSDVIVLCSECHELFHRNRKIAR